MNRVQVGINDALREIARATGHCLAAETDLRRVADAQACLTRATLTLQELINPAESHKRLIRMVQRDEAGGARLGLVR